MGLEYPYLAIVSTIIFTGIITGVLLSYLLIAENISAQPHFESFVSYEPLSGGSCQITYNIRFVSGSGVSTLQGLEIFTDNGTISITQPGSYVAPNGANVNVTYVGFDGKLYMGQGGLVLVKIDDCTNLFINNSRHSVLAFLDDGTLISYFQTYGNS